MMSMEWKEVARDLKALGSLPLYVLVIGRALVGLYWPFVVEMVAALIVVQLLGKSTYVARFFCVGVFTVLFYQSWVYGMFFAVVAGLFLWSVREDIGEGLLVGMAACFVGYAVRLGIF